MGGLRSVVLVAGMSLVLSGCSSSGPKAASAIPSTPSFQAAKDSASSRHYRVLYSFKGGADGADPQAGLIEDAAGNLYGTTVYGGGSSNCFSGCGVVFKIDPAGNETVLHRFDRTDGYYPAGGLNIDAYGNLYGTTVQGGGQDQGVVFKIDPTGNLTILHSFTPRDGKDGSSPYAGLTWDSAGNLYGTTSSGGGSNGYGVVFKIDPAGIYTVVHNFSLNYADGCFPQAPLFFSTGNLYGTTYGCGAGWGTVFKMDLTGHETVLFNFTSKATGYQPISPVIRDNHGIIYGTTVYGGTSDAGVVYRVDRSGNETILHSFDHTDGLAVLAGVLRDSSGVLYGTTARGGAWNRGVLFKLLPNGILEIHHSFGFADGGLVFSPVIRDANHNLIGTAELGGQYHNGVVYEYMP